MLNADIIGYSYVSSYRYNSTEHPISPGKGTEEASRRFCAWLGRSIRGLSRFSIVPWYYSCHPLLWQVDDNREDVSEDEKKKDVDDISSDKLIQPAKKKTSVNVGNMAKGKVKKWSITMAVWLCREHQVGKKKKIRRYTLSLRSCQAWYLQSIRKRAQSPIRGQCWWPSSCTSKCRWSPSCAKVAPNFVAIQLISPVLIWFVYDTQSSVIYDINWVDILHYLPMWQPTTNSCVHNSGEHIAVLYWKCCDSRLGLAIWNMHLLCSHSCAVSLTHPVTSSLALTQSSPLLCSPQSSPILCSLFLPSLFLRSSCALSCTLLALSPTLLLSLSCSCALSCFTISWTSLQSLFHTAMPKVWSIYWLLPYRCSSSTSWSLLHCFRASSGLQFKT